VSVVAADTRLDQVDIWWRKDLPEGTHNFGPGDTECEA